MAVYIIATVSTTLLIALIMVLAIVMVASQMWMTGTNSDTGMGGYSFPKSRLNNSLNKFDTRQIDKLIERAIKHTMDDKHFDSL